MLWFILLPWPNTNGRRNNLRTSWRRSHTSAIRPAHRKCRTLATQRGPARPPRGRTRYSLPPRTFRMYLHVARSACNSDPRSLRGADLASNDGSCPGTRNIGGMSCVFLHCVMVYWLVTRSTKTRQHMRLPLGRSSLAGVFRFSACPRDRTTPSSRPPPAAQQAAGPERTQWCRAGRLVLAGPGRQGS